MLVAHLDGRNYPGANAAELLYAVNADVVPHTLPLPTEANKPWRLHPALSPDIDPRLREARLDPAGTLTMPARTDAVFIVPE